AVPMGRMGSPDEIAKVVTFLASDESNFVTSIDLSVNRYRTSLSCISLIQFNAILNLMNSIKDL
ncbi:MAG: SDR family oxidoreductase, partial [Thermoproteota archaeon]|nr:SDR family oxidoreductase [Thermoproteota archaeon]